MNKTIKETFIENMIMNQHGEKIKKVQELMIEKIKNSKQSIERSIVRVVANNNDVEVLNEYKLRLKNVEELLHKVRYDFLNVDLDTIFIEVAWDNKDEYEELLEALKQPSKCESCVHTYKIEDKGCPVNDTQLAKIHENETILNSEETEEILNNIRKSEKVMDNIIQELGEKTNDSGEEIGKALSDVVNIFINGTDLNHSHKDVAEWARKLSEVLKKSKGSW